MKAPDKWKNLSWKHEFWDVLRFYVSLPRGEEFKRRKADILKTGRLYVESGEYITLDNNTVSMLVEYLEDRDRMCREAAELLRTEAAAKHYCEDLGFSVLRNSVKIQGYHQSSKAMISAVTNIATKVCSDLNLTLNPNPQNRAVWLKSNQLHVTARNLDGCIPSLYNPAVVWEIKEYWGVTKGGSKMSDAVYECHLVGRELAEYREKSGANVQHVVFLDGREQWGYRRSDMLRFIDLLNQGFIDALFIGHEVESAWEPYLYSCLESVQAS